MKKCRPWLLGSMSAILAGSAAAQSGQLSRADCDGQATAIYTVPGTHSQPPYPPISQRLGEQGISVLQLVIGHGGTVEAAMTLSSSGSNRLDLAAQDWVRQNWRWQANRVACRSLTTIVTIRWHLMDAAPVP